METPLSSIKKNQQTPAQLNPDTQHSTSIQTGPDALPISQTDDIFKKLKEPKIRRKKQDRIASTSPSPVKNESESKDEQFGSVPQ